MAIAALTSANVALTLLSGRCFGSPALTPASSQPLRADIGGCVSSRCALVRSGCGPRHVYPNSPVAGSSRSPDPWPPKIGGGPDSRERRLFNAPDGRVAAGCSPHRCLRTAVLQGQPGQASGLAGDKRARSLQGRDVARQQLQLGAGGSTAAVLRRALSGRLAAVCLPERHCLVRSGRTRPDSRQRSGRARQLLLGRARARRLRAAHPPAGAACL